MADAALRRALRDVMPVVSRRLRELEKRLHALEGENDPDRRLRGLHLGTWEEDRTYPPGTFTTHAGSLWWATAPTTERPGEGKTAWRLVVKQGRASTLEED